MFLKKNLLLILPAVFHAATALEIETYDHCINPGDIALTFEDGPNIENTNKILDLLEEEDVKATFFVNGKSNIESNPKLKKIIERQYMEGHIIGCNTYSYPIGISKLSDEELTEEVNKINDAIYDIIEVRPSFFRPPHGEYSRSNLETLEKCDISANILWNLDSEDWNENSNAFEKYKSILSNASPSTNSFITLNHDDISVNELEKIIQYVKSLKYNFVTMDECTGVNPYQDFDDININDSLIDKRDDEFDLYYSPNVSVKYLLSKTDIHEKPTIVEYIRDLDLDDPDIDTTPTPPADESDNESDDENNNPPEDNPNSDDENNDNNGEVDDGVSDEEDGEVNDGISDGESDDYNYDDNDNEDEEQYEQLSDNEDEENNPPVNNNNNDINNNNNSNGNNINTGNNANNDDSVNKDIDNGESNESGFTKINPITISFVMVLISSLYFLL